MFVERQFKHICTAEANVAVQVVLQSEGGFPCVWKTVWHSVVHCVVNTLNVWREGGGGVLYNAQVREVRQACEGVFDGPVVIAIPLTPQYCRSCYI